MTHDELLNKIIKSGDTSIDNALRAVVELHQPQDITLPDGSWGENCCICNNGWAYPCRTIQVIQEELN